ncbi:hypothetical protein [Desulfobacterium sp. N47]|uniref:hypothetical protein n=1 Tax=Desulfobacterium sp. N47 TaxID=3115210 RepID=UPI003F49E778
MRIEPEINNVSIVLVGNLNPAIFHPAWFVANNILSKEDLKSAKVEIIHQHLAVFKVGDWLHLTAEPNRFISETSEPPFVRLSDFVVKTFGEALIHTPISQMGINRLVHFSVGDEETRNKIGKKLAPQEVWGEWAPFISGKKQEKHGGMVSITMQQVDLDDREAGQIQARVEPSLLIKNGSGISVTVNDHYEISKEDSLNGAIRMSGLLVP